MVHVNGVGRVAQLAQETQSSVGSSSSLSLTSLGVAIITSGPSASVRRAAGWTFCIRTRTAMMDSTGRCTGRSYAEPGLVIVLLKFLYHLLIGARMRGVSCRTPRPGPSENGLYDVISALASCRVSNRLGGQRSWQSRSDKGSLQNGTCRGQGHHRLELPTSAPRSVPLDGKNRAGPPPVPSGFSR